MSPYYQCIILSFSLTILFITLPPSSADTQLIVNTCKKISQAEPSINGNYHTCVNFLQSDPRSATATLTGLAEISLQLATKKTVEMEDQVRALLESSMFDALVKKRLTECSQLYANAERSLGEVLQAFREKDYVFAMTHTSAVEVTPSTCEHGFKGQVSPLTRDNKQIHKVYLIALAFTDMFL